MVRNVPSRSESNQASADAAVELEAQAAYRHEALPAGLQIEWLGVSGYRLTYENRELFIDPYLSRVPLSSLLLRRTALPEADIDRALLPARARASRRSACSSATPTSTTPSTRPSSPAASAARPTARSRCSG